MSGYLKQVFDCCCPCLSWPDPEPALLSAPPHGSYTVRRISSFGQTVINEHGEESEIGRHCSVIQEQGYNGIPWSSKPSMVQPGVSDVELKERVRRMPVITESEPPLGLRDKSSWHKKPLTTKAASHGSLESRRTAKNLSDENIGRSQHSKSGLRKEKSWGSRIVDNSIETPQELLQGSLEDLKNRGDMRTESLECVLDEPPPTLESKEQPLSTPKPSSVCVISEEKDRVAREHGLDPGLYKQASCLDFWHEEPAGTVLITADCKDNQLNVEVDRLEGIPGEGASRAVYRAVVRLTLMPGARQERSTSPLPPAATTPIAQDFAFTLKPSLKALRLSVYNCEWQNSLHEAVGHALLPLEEISAEPTSHRLKLLRQTQLEESAGILQISLMCREECIELTVIKAYKLIPELQNCKLYLKVMYFSLSKKVKDKTSVAQCPIGVNKDVVVFNYSAKFKIDTLGLEHNYVMVSLKRRDHMLRGGTTRGRVLLGPYFFSEGGRRLTPWGLAIINKEKLTHSFVMYL